ncbi:MAG TPA: TIGR01777 family oxidoreductase [Acidimicrobiales bacterium]|nr:TIGR01777 family oxidoreductase [Acidimicrobiales bacterium]
MRVAITGSSGLIGSALVTSLENDGHTVVRVVRRAPSGAHEARWDPDGGTIDAAALEGLDAVVHLAGEGIGEKRWTPAQKQRIRDSRVLGTTLLAETLAGLSQKPQVLVSGSAIGWYGLRGDEVLTEHSTPGSGFLAEVSRAWEDATAAAEAAAIRVVHLRTGIVLAAKGGSMGRLLPLFKLGLGGKIGRGDQWWSWVTLDDEVGLIRHAIATPDVRGPMNATAPNPARNADITRALGAALHRPTFLSVPKFALGIALGHDLAEEVALAGQRVLPEVATSTGYQFHHPDLDTAIPAVVGRAVA